MNIYYKFIFILFIYKNVYYIYLFVANCEIIAINKIRNYTILKINFLKIIINLVELEKNVLLQN